MSHNILSSALVQHSTQSPTPRRTTKAITRYFTLQKGQCLEIPRESSALKVLSGTAWVIVDKRDVVLSSGQERLLPIAKYPNVVSVLGDRPVSLAVRCRRSPHLT
jgi:hypothetical protein